MNQHDEAGIRALTREEMAMVGGGWYDDGLSTTPSSGTEGLNGGDQYAGLGGKLFDLGVKVVSGFEALNWAVEQTRPGYAGPGGNENDNGGTSYGLGVCSTYGCSR